MTEELKVNIEDYLEAVRLENWSDATDLAEKVAHEFTVLSRYAWGRACGYTHEEVMEVGLE